MAVRHGVNSTARPTSTGKTIDQYALFRDTRWWSFCLGILAFHFILLASDPVPQLFMGDSGSYLWTALSGWIPPQRSFLYGYVIRWSSLWAKSLIPLLILQSFVGAITAILVALICHRIFTLSLRVSFLFGFLSSLDPLQLVWQRYVMTETMSVFFYALMLLFSFYYLKERCLWQLAIVQTLAVSVISFRMSYLLLVQASAFFLPLLAFGPDLRALLGRPCSVWSKVVLMKSAGLHLIASILMIFVLHNGYRYLNGTLAHSEPAYLHASGLSILTTWAPVLEPADAPDPRLANLISEGDRFELRDRRTRDNQLYSPGYLAARWKQIERRADVQNQIAKRTALHAFWRNPMSVLALGTRTFLDCWDFNRTRYQMKRELGKAGNNWPRTETWEVAPHFNLSRPPPGDAEVFTPLQRYYLNSEPYYFVVLLSPFVCGVLIFFVRNRYLLLLLFHSWILLATVTILSKDVSVRYVQPMSLLTILMFATSVETVVRGKSFPSFLPFERFGLSIPSRAAQRRVRDL